jgi:Glyoxalase/Bleomycin resistance protein/Dioxygenase superfamily
MRRIGPVYQIAYIVEDLEAGCRDWARLHQAGPFYVMRHLALADTQWRGKPVSVDFSIALGFSGPLMIELIQVHGPQKAIYGEMGDAPHPLMHHVARLSDDMDAAITLYEKQGCPVLFSGAFGPGSRLAYVDTRIGLGCFTELVEYSPGIEGLLQVMEDGHADWEGNWDSIDLIRSF